MAKCYFRSNYSNYQSEPCENAICVPLNRGKHALIDLEDFNKIGENVWAIQSNGYVKRSNGGGAVCLLHRLILCAPIGLYVDHINGDKLDNRKCNLRLCTATENARNRPGISGTSKYKGVRWNHKSWHAQIYIGKRNITIGRFNCEIEAALAYNKRAKAEFGEFAWLNVIVDPAI